MRKKIIGIIIGMLLITTLLPTLSATPNPATGNKREVFNNCYIEATGDIEPSGGWLGYVMFKYLLICILIVKISLTGK